MKEKKISIVELAKISGAGKLIMIEPVAEKREVAKKLKISRSYVSRIEKKALEKLKISMNP